MTQRHPKAFTLIELLVVISIIALLISILLPALASARATARQSACSSQLRQVNLAMNTYAAENEDTIPYAFANGGSTWDMKLTKFLNARTNARMAVMECPSDAVPRLGWSQDRGGKRSYSMIRNENWDAPVSRWWSLGPGREQGEAGGRPALRLSEALAAASTFVLSERVTNINGLGYGFDASFNAPGQQLGWAPKLHEGNVNYAYLDGHNSTLKPEQTLGTGADPNSLNPTLGYQGANARGAWTVSPAD